MSKFTVILENCDDDILYKVKMDISGKTVSSMLEETVELWYEDVKTSKRYSLDFSQRKENGMLNVSIIRDREDEVYETEMDISNMKLDDIFTAMFDAWKEEIYNSGLRIRLVPCEK